jgi:hypothetical protein
MEEKRKKRKKNLVIIVKNNPKDNLKALLRIPRITEPRRNLKYRGNQVHSCLWIRKRRRESNQ